MTDKSNDEHQQDAATSSREDNEISNGQSSSGPAVSTPQAGDVELENTRVPDLLARIANRIAETENTEVDALNNMKERLASLKEQASDAASAVAETSTDAADGDIASNGTDSHGPDMEIAAERIGSTMAKSSDERGTFASVEAALSKLSNQVDEAEKMHGGSRAALGVIAGSPEKPWNTDAAETLATHCEDVGLADAQNKDDLLIGDVDAAPTDARVSYVYLQPDAQELGQKWFEERFDTLAQNFEQAAGGARHGEAATPELMEKLDALEARFSELLGYPTEDGEPASNGSLHDIELCIAEIATQLEETTNELKRIETIESQISDIAKSLAAQGGQAGGAVGGGAMFDAALVADQLAERMSSKPMAFAGGGNLDAGDAAGMAELSTVMKEFMRERRNEGEHTNAVLDTMQQTIIRVLDRMETLETNGPRTPSNNQSPAPAPTPSAWSAAPAASAATATSLAVQPSPEQHPTSDIEYATPGTAVATQSKAADEKGSAARSASASASEGADAQSLNRLQRVMGELENTEPATPTAQLETEARQPLERQPADRRPVTSRIRAEFIAASRQSADVGGAADVYPEPPALSDAEPSEGVDSERARFAQAARNAAAKVGQRISGNDDAFDDEIDATDDGFSAGNMDAASLKPRSKTSGRARVLVAALAIVAIGLGATKLMMSLSSDAAREQLQTNRVQQGSSLTGEQAKNPPTKVSDVTAQPVAQPVSVSAGQAIAPPSTAQFNPSAGADIRRTAVSPDAATTPSDNLASTNPGSVSRKALPSALVGPLSLRLAAANGDASAEFQVASRFADGKGVSQNFEEAIKWYTRSAGRGFALAQYRLGTLYERGLGVEKDPHRASVWYQRAAAQQNIKSMHNLAVLAASSTGGNPDYSTAAKWFTEAAERGLGDSQFNLAILYQNGLGVPQDDGQAYRWFNLAATSGDREAMKRMTAIALKLGQTKTAVIDRELKGWMRKPADTMANDPHVAGQAWQRKS